VEKLKKQETELLAQLRALDRTFLNHKISRAVDIVGVEPPDREAFNAALRALFKAVVIDYRARGFAFNGTRAENQECREGLAGMCLLDGWRWGKVSWCHYPHCCPCHGTANTPGLSADD
jgi:hypothetical protein